MSDSDDAGDYDMEEDPGYIEYLEAQAKRLAELEANQMPAGMRVRVHHGTEGPRHDPYSFSRHEVLMPDGRAIVYRSGMIEELTVDGVCIMRGGGWGSDDQSIYNAFETLVGWPIDQLEWWEGAAYRDVPCMACGCEGCRGKCCE